MTPPVWDRAMLGFSCFPERLVQVGGLLPVTTLPLRQARRSGAPSGRSQGGFPGSDMIPAAAVQSGYLRCGSSEDFFEAGAELIFRDYFLRKNLCLSTQTDFLAHFATYQPLSTFSGYRHASKSHELKDPAVCHRLPRSGVAPLTPPPFEDAR